MDFNIDSLFHPQVVAVAARSLASAKELADKFKVPQALEGYDKLASNPEVDIVYIGTIHSTHKDLTMYCNFPKHLHNTYLVKVLTCSRSSILCTQDDAGCRKECAV